MGDLATSSPALGTISPAAVPAAAAAAAEDASLLASRSPDAPPNALGQGQPTVVECLVFIGGRQVSRPRPPPIDSAPSPPLSPRWPVDLATDYIAMAAQYEVWEH